MNYHAHIYWKHLGERVQALSLRLKLLELGCELGAVHDKPIGPHPLPMYQVMYDSSNQNAVESLLATQTMSILLHEDVGIDHVRDHTEGARWFGKSLDLDLEFLARFQD